MTTVYEDSSSTLEKLSLIVCRAAIVLGNVSLDCTVVVIFLK